ncbi:MAG TPA: BatD family protein [Polyangiales bacterium]|nr:BatD family protein [Polyangiales bacterium]
MSRGLSVFFATGCLLLFAAGARADVRVEMTADRTSLTMNDQVAVRIFVQTSGSEQPEIAIPEFEGFQITQRAVQRPMQFSFGFGQQAPMVTASTQYTFVLQPVGAGTFKIPPVRVTMGRRLYQSQALTLTVAGAANSQGQTPVPQQQQQQQQQQPGAQPSAADPQAQQAATPTPQATGDAAIYDNDAFLRTVIDKTEPYEGEQLTATIYLYTRRNLQQVPAVQSEASTDGLWTHDLLSATRSLEPKRQVINGRGFWVYTLRRFAAFPLRSGELTLGSMALTISRDSVFDLFDPSSAQPDLKRSSVPIVLHVKPLPPEGKPKGDVAVGHFEIQSQLDRKQVVTGDAVTLSAIIKGQGNIRAVRVADPVVNGLQILQPETHDLVEAPGERVQGTRTMTWLVVPKAPGVYTLPPLEFDSFDPATQSYQRVRSAPLTLTAAGNARPETSATQDALPPATDETGSEAPSWPTIRPASELRRARAPLASHTLYPFALALLPLIWLGAVIAPSLRRMRADEAGDAQRKAVQQAEKRLASAREALAARDPRRFHSELAASLLALLATRLHEPVSGMTQPELRAVLAARGLPEAQAKRLLGILGECDFARFSASAVTEGDMQQRLAQAEILWPQLSAFSPSAPEAA